jgi:hypothetical protein
MHGRATRQAPGSRVAPRVPARGARTGGLLPEPRRAEPDRRGAAAQDRVALRFLLAAASDITASDVDLAFASEGIILGFNQEPSDAVQAAAKQLGARRARRHAWPVGCAWLRPRRLAQPGRSVGQCWVSESLTESGCGRVYSRALVWRRGMCRHAVPDGNA